MSFNINITEKEGLTIVMGHEVEGGIKRIALEYALQKIPEDNIVFCTTSLGGGPLALTLAANALDKKPIIYLSETDKMSQILEECQELGAELIWKGSEMNATTLVGEANLKYHNDSSTHVLPEGMENSDTRQSIIDIASNLPLSEPPKEVWVTVGSGLNIRALQEVWPEATFHGVTVKHNNPNIGNAIAHSPPMAFSEAIKQPKGFPEANANYENKMWAEIIKDGAMDRKGVLAWTVA